MGIRRIITTLVILWAAQGLRAQTVEELRGQMEAAQAEIEATNALLSRAESDRRENFGHLQLVQNNLDNYRTIIASLDRQVAVVSSRVNEKTRAIAGAERQLEALRAEYAALVRAAYRGRQTHNALAFLFAARDFNDVARRLFYIKRYTRIREQKGVQIDSIRHRLQADVEVLASQKDSLSRIVASRNVELGNLQREEGEFRRIDSSLRSRARQYGEQIAGQQRLLKSLQDRIERIIAEAARRSQATPLSAAEEEAFVRLTGRFDENRGRLPWPVGGPSAIYERFGSHRHRNFPNVTINKKEIDIAAERGAPVRAVFDGTVHQVFLTPGANNTVLIRHGEYFTVYSNLETVAVKAGDPVAGNQRIGNVVSGTGAENYLLSFGIWKGMEPLDPEGWIRR